MDRKETFDTGKLTPLPPLKVRISADVCVAMYLNKSVATAGSGFCRGVGSFPSGPFCRPCSNTPKNRSFFCFCLLLFWGDVSVCETFCKASSPFKIAQCCGLFKRLKKRTEIFIFNFPIYLTTPPSLFMATKCRYVCPHTHTHTHTHTLPFYGFCCYSTHCLLPGADVCGHHSYMRELGTRSFETTVVGSMWSGLVIRTVLYLERGQEPCYVHCIELDDTLPYQLFYGDAKTIDCVANHVACMFVCAYMLPSCFYVYCLREKGVSTWHFIRLARLSEPTDCIISSRCMCH